MGVSVVSDIGAARAENVADKRTPRTRCRPERARSAPCVGTATSLCYVMVLH